MSEIIRSYRLYFLDTGDHIARAHDIEAPSDDGACEIAARMLSEQSHYACVEVWDRARKVFRHP